MFTKEALELLQNAPAIDIANIKLSEAKPAIPIFTAPSDFQVHNLEKFMDRRARFRGVMDTRSLDDYVRYCTEHALDGAACFIAMDDMAAATIFNLGDICDPGHADYRAYLQLQALAEYTSLLGINGERLNQKRLAEFMEDYRDFITCYSADGEAVDTVRAIGAVRRITIAASRQEDHEQQDFKASRSSLENIEARSEMGLPAGFRFNCTPYTGLRERSFDLRLSVLTGGDAPVLTARIKRLEAEQEDMAQELADLLSEAFEKTDIQTYIGGFKP